MSDSTPEVIFHNGRFTTLNKAQPTATAVAVKDGRFIAVGTDAEVLALAGSGTRRIDLQRRSVLPGLFDNHTHVIRGGLNFNLELRWDGVRSLADALDMLKRQVANTPAPQWVRVVGGFTEHQFVEKRLPTIEEINAIAPDTPVFLLHLYDRALLNAAALRAVGYTRDTPEPAGGEITRDANGNPTGLLLAKPNATILYATLAKGPKLPLDYQVNSTRHFMRELNRLGVTGVIDAGVRTSRYLRSVMVISCEAVGWVKEGTAEIRKDSWGRWAPAGAGAARALQRAVSTSTSSASVRAVTRRVSTSLMAAPSRSWSVTPSICTEPLAGTR